MDRDTGTLSIAEIPYDDGSVRFRYSRYLDASAGRWVRHGLFRAFHPNGRLASEGEYADGVETGAWRDFHESGQLAAEGSYLEGKEEGVWRFYDEAGRLQQSVRYYRGVESSER